MPYNRFYEALDEARARTGTSNGSAWYRGIHDGRYQLLPSLLRLKNRHHQAEINIFADFWTMIEGVEISDNWQRLSFMQHYGVPTRLLDWTSDLNIALYFALNRPNSLKSGDPCIWVLNPFKLNEAYCGIRKIFDAVDRPDFDYYEAAKTDAFPNQLPIALRPMWSNARVRAQSGGFTFHGNKHEPLDELVRSKIAKRVHIDHAAVKLLREKITSEGVNHFRVYTGPESLALHLKMRYLS